MRRFPDIVYSHREVLLLGFTVFVSFLLILSNDNAQVNTLRGYMLDAVGLFQSEVLKFYRLFDVYAENRRLREALTRLAYENNELKEALLENARLRKLLGFAARSQLELIPARVIGYSTTGAIKSVILEGGKDKGLKRNMAMITPEGLAGKIFSVGRRHSVGQLLNDQNFRVSGTVQRSRVHGIVQPRGGSVCVFSGVPNRSDVKVGDVVVTSGYSLIFPPGLRIGIVVSVNDDPKGLFSQILITPRVDLTSLEEVFVVRSPVTTVASDQVPE